MEHINSFVGGVDRDTEDIYLSPQVLRALQNMRLQSTDGKSGTLVNLRGMEPGFNLSDGFLPLGYAVHFGVAFIFSYRPLDGMCEVGTFPSPLLGCGGGYERVYRPLQNWNGAIDPSTGIFRQNFTTPLFYFDCEHQLEVEAREGYDGSVDLFFADYKNPLRRINTGFDVRTGICNNRMLWEGSFPNAVNVFFESCGHPYATSVSLGDGGALESGIYFCFFAYVQEDLSQTSYIGQAGPIQVTVDTLLAGVQLDGNAEGVNTGRSITLNLANIDNTFPYLRVAVVNYTADTINTGVIATLYPIEAGQTTMTITITGLEELGDIALADIIRRKALDDCPKSLTQRDNILFGANWKERELPVEDLRNLAQMFLANPNPNQPQVPLPHSSAVGWMANPAGNHHYENTRTLNGYFRGESYPYALVVVFKDGKESIAYPVRGQDAWVVANGQNTKGILRFPPNMAPGFAFYTPNQQARPLGVRFDHGGAPVPAWVTDRVCGFYFMRGERKKNLLYQGYVANAYRGTGAANDPANASDIEEVRVGTVDISEFTFRMPYAFPHYESPQLTVPTEQHHDPVVGISYINMYSQGGNPTAGRFGLFSTDHLFKKAIVDGLYTIVKQGQVLMTGAHITSQSVAVGEVWVYPDYFWDALSFIPDPADPSVLNMGRAMISNIAPRAMGQNYGYTSFLEWGDQSTDGLDIYFYLRQNISGAKHEEGNRRMVQRNYLGLSFKDATGGDVPGAVAIDVEDDPAINPSGVAMVNVYLEDPLTSVIESLYDPAFTVYFRISDFIPVSDWATIPAMVFYHGDCYIARTYHRQMNEGGFHPADQNAYAHGDDPGGDDTFAKYRYGNLMGYVQECAINTAMRYQESGNEQHDHYYPEISSRYKFVIEDQHRDETRLLNNGYNQQLGPYSMLGDDIAVLTRTARYITRVRHSVRYEPDNAQDGWMSWDLSAKSDYDIAYGAIHRIITHDDRTLIAQERAVQLLHINREALVGDEANQGQLLIGAGSILSDNAQLLTNEFGSQHQWSVGKTAGGVYGYDLQRRKAWRVYNGQMDLLSDRLSFVKDMHEAGETPGTQSDVVSKWMDAPVCHSGITFYWDRKNKELGWSFMWHVEQSQKPWPMIRRTYAYNEELNKYMHARTHHSSFYLLLNEDLYALDMATMPQTVPNASVVSSLYLMDADTAPRLSFFGVQHEAVASWVENSAPAVIKAFDAIWLRSTDLAPTYYLAETEFHSCTQNPFLNPAEFEYNPVYRENMWRFPLRRADTVVIGGSQEYGVGSELRGNWLRMTVVWSTDQPITFALAQGFSRPSVQ